MRDRRRSAPAANTSVFVVKPCKEGSPMNEKQLCATAYALNGLEKHGYPVRVLRVLDAVPNDDLRPVRLQRWADSLWRTLRVPVFPRGDSTPPVFLVPA